MTRPYSPSSPYDATQTERISSGADQLTEKLEPEGYQYDYDGYDGYDEYDECDSYAEFEDYDDPIDRRWIWIAGAAGAILLVAVICTVVILGGGDSGSVSATVSSPATTSQPATTSAPPVATSKPAPATSLPPETVTTVTPSQTATAAPSAPPAATPAPPAPNTVTYTVTGNRQLIDLVTVIYTDRQGALQTDVNVALPWTKTVVLDPGVEISSVTATSVAGQLNCSITDAAGATIAAQTNNSIIATCTK